MFDIEIEGSRVLENLALSLKKSDPKKILEESATYVLHAIRKRFLAETDPEGHPWPPSKAAIIRRSGGYTYRDGKKYTGTGTLFETGRLFHSLQMSKATDDTIFIGTDVPYARALQEGTRVLPPRVFLGVSTQDLAGIKRIILNRLEQEIKESR